MSVRMSLLAILDHGPCYGYQLRSEFERRTGGARPLNVGQIYNTLDRLERDGLVAKGDADPAGHVYYRITPAGSDEVGDWLLSPVAAATGARDELPLKLALAASLPRVEVAPVLRAQRRASQAALAALRSERHDRESASGSARTGELLAWQIVADGRIAQVEAELRLLDHVEARVLAHPAPTLPLGPASERPRRGRPPKAGAPRPRTAAV
ncbi:PadR family transcriptional regulator [Microbacterium sp. HA-8]|uniref:PadR family transcriptional regulator n=1 Tax=Microbacterium sp. HA-8 TaxID=3234200 RepID=UPI0038F77B1D